MRPVLFASALGALFILFPLLARGTDAPPRSPTERREQLQRLSDELNDPDAFKRLATLEAVLQSDDLLAREVATRVALGSSDTQMRGYAALLLLSRTKVINLELKLPPRIQGQVDEAKGEQEKLNALAKGFPITWADQWTNGGTVAFQFRDFDLASGTFKAACQAEQQRDTKDFDGQMTGATLQFRGQCRMRAGGLQMCSATMTLEAQGVFSGTFACAAMEVPLSASFRLQ